MELAGASGDAKLNKPERELRAFLELHRGRTTSKGLEDMVKHASPAACAFANERGDPFIKPETVAMKAAIQARHEAESG